MTEEFTKKNVYESYVKHSGDRHTNATKFWKDLTKLTDYSCYGKNKLKCKLPSVEECRAKWRIIYNDPNWTFDDVNDEDVNDEEKEQD
jgi:hypothetical protein